MRIYWILCLVVVWSALSFAQTPQTAPQGSAAPKIDTPHLTVTTSVGNGAAGTTGRISLFVDVIPKPRMHVYSPAQKTYIPIALTLEPNPAFKAQPSVYPPAEKFFFEPLKETQLVYSKPFRIVQDIIVSPGARSGGPLTIKGTLRYQACDDEVCYVPRDLALMWTIVH